MLAVARAQSFHFHTPRETCTYTSSERDNGSSACRRERRERHLGNKCEYEQRKNSLPVTRPKREVGERVRVNVSGKPFETYMSTLTRRDGSIFKLESITKMYDSTQNEYYFERDSRAFEGILVYMQSGVLDKPESVPYRVWIEELQHFGFADIAKQLYKETCVYFERQTINIDEGNSLRSYIWNVLQHPRLNAVSRTLTLLSSLTIIISIVLLCISTLPSVKSSPDLLSTVHNVEYFCLAWFTMETCIRFVTCQEKKAFIANPQNVIDVLSFLPVYMVKIFQHTWNGHGNHVFLASSLRILRISRLIPAFASHKFVRTFNVMMLTLVDSAKEFTCFLSMFIFVVVLFSCLLYVAENGDEYYNEDLSSVPKNLWFCLVTITSVGYGDIVPTSAVPTSAGGRCITVVMFGATILLLSLPVPIIIENFMKTYEMLKSDSTLLGFTFDPDKSKEVERRLYTFNQKDESEDELEDESEDELDELSELKCPDSEYAL